MPYKDKRKTAEAMRRYRERKKQQAFSFEMELRRMDRELARKFRELFLEERRKVRRKH